MVVVVMPTTVSGDRSSRVQWQMAQCSGCEAASEPTLKADASWDEPPETKPAQA